MDFETASEADLELVGLANYLDHPSTRVLMSAYAEGDGKPKLWEPHRNPKPPAELVEAIEDPFVIINGWNVAFERWVTQKLLGLVKPISEWRCTMIKARYLSLPGKLEAAGEVLGLGEDEAKIKDGSRLISKFCSPSISAKEGGLFGSTPAGFKDWSTDPEDWEKFGIYCKRDVTSERTIGKKCDKFPLPDHEWETWFLDQKINSFGWPVNRDLVHGAGVIIERDVARLTKRLRELTGLENPSSVPQMMEWLKSQNYLFSGLNKTFVERALAGECDLTEAAKEALIIRKQTAKSSIKKYGVITHTVSPDGRLRHQYSFLGAARTGRWAAHGANVGNLPKPEKNVEKRLELAVDLVQKMDYEGLIREFNNPLDVVSSTIRPSFAAPKGFKFVVCDLAAIENIMLSYICRCNAIRQVFVDGRDPYIDFATRMYNQTYEELWAEYQAGDKTKRTIAKPATLACGYAMGPGEEGIGEDGQKYWTGLMKYSRDMKIEMSQEDAIRSVKIFRQSYPEVTRSWKDFERAAIRAIKKPGEVVGVGVPQSDRDREYFISKGRDPNVEPIISFRCTSNKVLEMMLPSGRSLHYVDPRVDDVEAVWEGKTYKKQVISYYGKEQNKQVWGRVKTSGGKILENADQSIARDILVAGMKEADAQGFQICGHTYDEIIALIPENGHLGEHEMEKCMTKIPWWCDPTLPLRAEAYCDTIYRKN